MDQHALNAIRAWNQRQRPDYKLITVQAVNPSIGAEILGVDLSEPICPSRSARPCLPKSIPR